MRILGDLVRYRSESQSAADFAKQEWNPVLCKAGNTLCISGVVRYNNLPVLVVMAHRCSTVHNTLYSYEDFVWRPPPRLFLHSERVLYCCTVVLYGNSERRLFRILRVSLSCHDPPSTSHMLAAPIAPCLVKEAALAPVYAAMPSGCLSIGSFYTPSFKSEIEPSALIVQPEIDDMDL